MKLLTAAAFLVLLASSEGEKSIGNLRRVLEPDGGVGGSVGATTTTPPPSCHNDGEPCDDIANFCCEGYTCPENPSSEGGDGEGLPSNSNEAFCIKKCGRDDEPCDNIANVCCEGYTCTENPSSEGGDGEELPSDSNEAFCIKKCAGEGESCDGNPCCQRLACSGFPGVEGSLEYACDCVGAKCESDDDCCVGYSCHTSDKACMCG
eukprot:CAMPEP_0197441212 /NCGR_PEP_ID=MMETSP1175-20131217/7537_1 /TAXON_ID=1003142 /ORGANISM="Triceratium dubium, Strain CCMP147" /LENGTH=205 /DNA_ID=CAMNT_0042971457 /DNA_START=126 /DNA_END=743 /DNA_ORIENTATION=-